MSETTVTTEPTRKPRKTRARKAKAVTKVWTTRTKYNSYTTARFTDDTSVCYRDVRGRLSICTGGFTMTEGQQSRLVDLLVRQDSETDDDEYFARIEAILAACATSKDLLALVQPKRSRRTKATKVRCTARALTARFTDGTKVVLRLAPYTEVEISVAGFDVTVDQHDALRSMLARGEGERADRYLDRIESLLATFRTHEDLLARAERYPLMVDVIDAHGNVRSTGKIENELCLFSERYVGVWFEDSWLVPARCARERVVIHGTQTPV